MTARDIIVRPVVTEKTMRLTNEENKITFIVKKNANKILVAQAIQEIYGIKPEKVNVVNVHSKTRRVGRYAGKTSALKKAIVQLPKGSSIELFGSAE